MASIWVIEDGEYSDYRVRGVFSSRENAELMIEKGLTGTIAEWTLDPSVDAWKKGLRLIKVEMNRAGDSHIEFTNSSWDETENETPWTMGPYHPTMGRQVVIRVVRFSDSEEHVVKVANEIRTRMIAEGAWK